MAAAADGCRPKEEEDATTTAAALLYDGCIVYGGGRLQGLLFSARESVLTGGRTRWRRKTDKGNKMGSGEGARESQRDEDRGKVSREGHLENDMKKFINRIRSFKASKLIT